MTRRDWWLGIAMLTLAILVHALVPRYEISWVNQSFMRVDRWTGSVEMWGATTNGHWLRVPQ